VRALTQAAAKEYASAGITVNAYCPGVVGTDMWITIDERFSQLTGAPKGETYQKFRRRDRAGTGPDSGGRRGVCVVLGGAGFGLHDRAVRADLTVGSSTADQKCNRVQPGQAVASFT